MNEQNEARTKRGLLRWLPPRLRTIPALGAIAIGSVMLLAAAIMLYPGSIPGFEPGGAQQVVFFVIFPLFFFGAWAVELMGRIMGRPHPPPKLDPAESNGLGLDPILIFLASLIINMFVVWAGLKVICWGIRLLSQKSSAKEKDPSAGQS